MSTENKESENLQLFQSDSVQFLTKELYESLFSVVVAGALGQALTDSHHQQVAYATWVLERTNSKTLEFRPDSREFK